MAGSPESARPRIRQSGLCSRPVDSAAAVSGPELLRGREGPPAGSWLTNEPDGCLAQGLQWALQVRQALVQVVLCSAAVLHKLERAQGDRVGADPPPMPRTGLPRLPLPGHPRRPASGWLALGFGGSRGRGAPRAAAVPACRQGPAGPGLRLQPWALGGKDSLCAVPAGSAGLQQVGRDTAASPTRWALGERGFSGLGVLQLLPLPCSGWPWAAPHAERPLPDRRCTLYTQSGFCERSP